MRTVNIHTHLIPFLLWSFAWFRFAPSYDSITSHEPAQVTFGVFALLCLFTSALWHTMAGCAHPKGMELCARVDYVGIGWSVLLAPMTCVFEAGLHSSRVKQAH